MKTSVAIADSKFPEALTLAPIRQGAVCARLEGLITDETSKTRRDALALPVEAGSPPAQ